MYYTIVDCFPRNNMYKLNINSASHIQSFIKFQKISFQYLAIKLLN